MAKEVKYKNADILLMDPAYSRWIITDEDTELECPDMVVDTLEDGLYCIFSGHLEEYDEELERFAKENAIGAFGLDTGRIGVYDYSKVMEEQSELKESIEKKKYLAAIINDFTGIITSNEDREGEIHIVGKSDDGQHDFFTSKYYDN